MTRWKLLAVLSLLLISIACVPVAPVTPAPEAQAPPAQTQGSAQLPAVAADIPQRLSQLPKTVIDYDRSLLNENERQVVDKLIEASKLIDQLFWLQAAERNPEWRAQLVEAAKTSDLHKSALAWFDIMKGPWDRIAEDEAFLLNAGPKPEGGGFYPEDMTKAEFETWVADHPADKAAFEGLFTVVRRQGSGLVAIPYSKYYNSLLVPAADRLREAAALTTNASLRDFLNKRADAFLSDDYYASDIAWMDLNGPIEVVIGPYEVYEDEMFNYKASFESFVTVVDKPESEKLVVYAKHLPLMEKALPIPDVHKNPNRGSESPISVVQEIYTAGDARRGVQTSAFNLPNDEKVREAKGSKKVLLKNVMDAKFNQSGKPIALRVLDLSQTNLLSFDAYFNHVLFHELSHGLGPGIITLNGQRVDSRLLLKNLYSAIEECKADVLGIWAIEYAMDNKLVDSFTREQLYATNAALLYRSMRFGIGEAHGRGTAVQWNWYRERGAIVPTTDGRFRVDFAKMAAANEALVTELLMIEATGDFDRAQKLLETYGKSTPEIEGVISRLTDIPVDIAPVFVGAGEKM